MLKTPQEFRKDLGQAIRARRLGMEWSQEKAALRAGMGRITWQRMEAHGPSLVENLINAAIALRCEAGLDQLFPAPAASSMDELLRRQKAAASPAPRKYARRSRNA